MDVGFIGVGSMGVAIVPHLIRAGHRVSVWNRNPDAARALEGVTVLASPSAVFDNDVVLTMLSDDLAVRSVIVESNALDNARKGCVHVMMSTISPALAGELQLLHVSTNAAYLAAPVFGIPATAASAQLNIMVAGDKKCAATVKPLFDVIGQKMWYLGEDARYANIAKIAGNMMIALAIEAIGEATALTESYGLKAADFLDVVTHSLFPAPSYRRYGENIATDCYEPGFKLSLGLKDLNLALEAAKLGGSALPAVEIVRASMINAMDQGMEAHDWYVFARTTSYRTAALKLDS